LIIVLIDCSIKGVRQGNIRIRPIALSEF
jgi:hypothetical protein